MVYTTESLFKVTKYTANYIFELKASIISFIKLKVAAIVDDLGLKPNCLSTNVLLLIKYWYIRTYRTFSNTLDNAGRRDMGL